MPPKRVLLKLSGETLCGEGASGIDATIVDQIAQQLKFIVHDYGLQVAVVVGGGNILRGATFAKQGTDRITADYMGMLATMMNALALQDHLERIGVETRVLTALETKQVAEPYIRRRAIRHLEKGRIVILAGGSGLPLFTTDTVAVLRAKELAVSTLFKATKVDGVYDKDPKTETDAQKYSNLSYKLAISKQLQVMDQTAFTLAAEHCIPIFVFNVFAENALKRALLEQDQNIGTLVHE